MKKFEYSITGNDVVPQNMIGDIFLGHRVSILFESHSTQPKFDV